MGYYPKKSTTTKKKSTTTKRKYYPKKPSVSKTLRAMAISVEHKVQGHREYDIQPSAIQTGSRCYSVNVVNTANNSGSNPTFQAINSLSFPKGDGRNNRTGEKMYFKDTFFRACVRMKENYQVGSLTNAEAISIANFQNTEFRMIIFQIKDQGRTTGAIPNAGQQLFLAPDGAEVGQNVSGIRGSDLMIMPTNKKRYVILKDVRFLLHPPTQIVTGSTGGGGQVHMTGKRSFKDITCKLSHNSIVHFGQASGNSNEPSSGNNNVYVSVFATNSVKTDFQDNWEMDASFTTTALDN